MIKSTPIDDIERSRFPYCIVWTPLPVLTWFIPFIGHMGIAYSNGVIRDFAGPYYVSEDSMAFGKPTRILRLDPSKVKSGESFDQSISKASEIYSKRMHNICCDNCHSHVARAMNLMQYDNSNDWNMVKLCFMMLFKGRFVSWQRALYTFAPFLLIVSVIVVIFTLV